jgi:hypothetical protein
MVNLRVLGQPCGFYLLLRRRALGCRPPGLCGPAEDHAGERRGRPPPARRRGTSARAPRTSSIILAEILGAPLSLRLHSRGAHLHRGRLCGRQRRRLGLRRRRRSAGAGELGLDVVRIECTWCQRCIPLRRDLLGGCLQCPPPLALLRCPILPDVVRCPEAIPPAQPEGPLVRSCQKYFTQTQVQAGRKRQAKGLIGPRPP